MSHEKRFPSLFYEPLAPIDLTRSDTELELYDGVMLKLDLLKRLPGINTVGDVEMWGMGINSNLIKELSCQSAEFLQKPSNLSLLVEYDRGVERRLHLMSSNRQVLFAIDKRNRLIVPKIGLREGTLIKKPWQIHTAPHIPAEDALVIANWLP